MSFGTTRFSFTSARNGISPLVRSLRRRRRSPPQATRLRRPVTLTSCGRLSKVTQASMVSSLKTLPRSCTASCRKRLGTGSRQLRLTALSSSDREHEEPSVSICLTWPRLRSAHAVTDCCLQRKAVEVVGSSSLQPESLLSRCLYSLREFVKPQRAAQN
jgi:hypothetical protein